MAVKASATVTLSCYRDTQSITRYYKLHSSTASAPSKPTTNPPPSGWTDAEPSYTSGSTNTLYFCDLSVFSDGTWSYSTVSKSSSYEAAKEAYNKAVNAQNSVNEMPNYIASRGENLVTNGTCLLGNNKNFSSFTYDGSETYYAGGSFKITSTGTSRDTDEFIPVDVSQKYVLSYYIKSSNASARYYDMLVMYDIDKNVIGSRQVMFIPGSTTTLAKELKNGDTTVYLTSASGFNTTTTFSYQRGLIFWNYTNSKGYTYGIETYSRNEWFNLWSDGSAINKTANTIALDSAWTHGTFPAGTPVSQCNQWGAYSYGNTYYGVTANTWTKKTAYWSGVGKNDANRKFREGTAFITVGWLINYGGSTSCDTWLSTISLTQSAGNSEVSNLVSTVDVEYYLSTSATSLSGGSWQTTAPTWVNGKYMWSRTKTTKGDGTVSYKPSANGTCIAGAKGDTGATGATGAAGKGVKSTAVTYQASTSGTTAPTGTWSPSIPSVAAGSYLWTRTVITYTDNSTSTSYSVGKMGNTGSKGDTGATGKGVKSTAVTYQGSTSGTTVPTGTWSSSIPSVAAGSFLWTRTIITYTDNSTSTSYSVGKMGNTGSKGDTGATGTGISSITEEYYLSTSKTSQTGGSWTTTPPTWSSGKYIWTRSKIVYTNPSSTVYTTPICDSSWEAANEVQKEVDEVKKRVTNAETKITQNESAISLRATKEEVESNGNRITLTESEIRQLADMIATLVTDENGASLMTQTANGGWTFSMGAISDKLAKTQEELGSLMYNMDVANSDLDTLKSALNDIGILADYVIITTYNGQPCIELGEAENAFKLRITNTEIQFAEGTTIPAYITNKKLMINSAEVKEELQFGGFVWKVRSNGNLGIIWKGVDG